MSFRALASTATQIGATRSRLRKVALAAALFAEASPDELPDLARFLGGRPFSARDERTLRVGASILGRAARAVLPWDEVVYGACVRVVGDAGETIGKLLEETPARAAPQRRLGEWSGPEAPAAWSATDARNAFESLAAADSTTKKVDLLARALATLSPIEAQVFVKLLFEDVRIGFGDPGVEEALAKAFGRPLADVRLASMLTGDLGETATLARTDTLRTARLVPGHPLQFMLASPVDAPPADPSAYLVEDKYDGVRTQVHRRDGAVRVFSRTLDEVTGRFPEVVAAATRLPGSFVLDGEVVAWRDGRVLPFGELQRRLGRKEPTPEIASAVPVRFVAYDLLYRDGRETFREPIEARRDALAALLGAAPEAFLLSASRRAASPEEIERLFEEARAAGNEGLVLKRAGTPYEFGKRARAWLKYKKAYATLDVVVTAAESGHGKRAGLLSDYTFAVRAEDGTLRNVGKAYIGVTDEEIRRLTARFRRITTRRYGSVHLVKPEVVFEVAFDAVQRSSRHAGGYALRFPRIVRIREDKGVADVDTLARVAELERTGAHSRE